ncbi:MAG: hypothetical protein KC503_47565 [Myxococcales bacterium]|nr:hypothetical protein [Myxococcales bacterium]
MTIAQLANLAIEHALATLVEKELLEIHPRRREDLNEELLKAVLFASDLDAAIKAAFTALVESDKPEEVYGADDELQAVFRDAFLQVEEAARDNLEAIASGEVQIEPEPTPEASAEDKLLAAMEQLGELDPEALAALVDLSDDDLDGDDIFEDLPDLDDEDDEAAEDVATAGRGAGKRAAPLKKKKSSG